MAPPLSSLSLSTEGSFSSWLPRETLKWRIPLLPADPFLVRRVGKIMCEKVMIFQHTVLE